MALYVSRLNLLNYNITPLISKFNKYFTTNINNNSNNETSSNSNNNDVTEVEDIVTSIPTDKSRISPNVVINNRPWSKDSKRTGLIAIKCGMTRIWDAWGQQIPVTIVKLDHCFVSSQKLTKSPKGYFGLQLACSLIHPKNCNKTMTKHLEKANLPPLRKLAEFPVTEDALLPPGLRMDVRHFNVGQTLDVIGTSKGHGFTGAMVRWNFSGQNATHGTSVSHRRYVLFFIISFYYFSLGATGSRQDPGKVFKGKKMAGRWGHERVTIRGVVIEKMDLWNELIFLHGSIPGVVGSYLLLRDSNTDNKEKFKAPFPTYKHVKGYNIF